MGIRVQFKNLVAALLLSSILAHSDSHAEVSATAAISVEKPSISTGNVGLAFGLVALAALFSLIGSLIPFLDSVPLLPFKIIDSELFLAGSFGLAGGVLVFLSLTDVLSEAQAQFASSTLINPMHSVTISLGLFFAAILILMGIKTLSARLLPHRHNEDNVIEINGAKNDIEVAQTESSNGSTLDSLIQKNHLRGTAIQIAVTIALHNFPEGVVLFTSTLQSASLGIAIAIGLIFHKLPEGVIIALPFYAASKSQWKSFLLAFVGSSFFLFLGAVLSYAVFTTYWDPLVGGILLSFTAGILFWLGLTSILPLALKLDPAMKVVPYGIFAGVLVIAVSESILSYTSG